MNPILNPIPMTQVYIDHDQACAVSPEGQKASMPLDRLCQKWAPPAMDTGPVVLPDGVKASLAQGNVVVWVHESPPRLYNFKWIAGHSPARFGKGTRYRQVRLALPYLIVLAVFTPDPKGRVTLSQSNECFFRNAPLQSLQDDLFYPALLNCSKFKVQNGAPLSWICSQHIDYASLNREPDLNRRLRAGFKALMHCLLEAGFNYSSEQHEGASWFSESCGVDPRISTVEQWQEASRKDPLFVLDVPWLPVGLNVEQVARRIQKNLGAATPRPVTANILARWIFNFNHQPASPQANEVQLRDRARI